MMVFGQKRGCISHPPGNYVKDRPVQSLRDFLGNQRHPQSLLTGDIPAIGLHFSADQLEQRGLPRAVPPQQTEAVPCFNLELNPVQEGRPAEGETDISQSKKGHLFYLRISTNLTSLSSHKPHISDSAPRGR